MKILISILLLTLSFNAMADAVFHGPVYKCEVTNENYIPSQINFSVYAGGIFDLGPQISFLYTFPEFNVDGAEEMSFISMLQETEEKKYAGKLTNVDTLVEVSVDLTSLDSVVLNLVDDEAYVFPGKCITSQF